MNWVKTLNLQVKLALPIVPMLSDYFLTTSSTSMTEEERANVAGMKASWKALAQVKPVMLFTQQQLSVIIFQPLLMQRFVYSPRTLKPSGTPLCSSLTRPQKPCSLTSLQPLSSPQSLTCSSQVPCRLKTFSWLCSESSETERFVGKLRRAGSLADFCCMPGDYKSLYANWLKLCLHLFDPFSWIIEEVNFSCTGIGHGHFFDASLECHQRFHEHFKLAIDKYLLE